MVRSAGRVFRALPTPVAVVLAVLIVLAVVAHLPLILVGLGAWFLLSRKGHWGHCSTPHSSRRGATWS